ncbi:MAG TPA: trehalose-phosphatase [Acidimicrobiia bacterium]|nr:trehalose-phosphatase [Acidimicrobiia bacterium]
MQDVDATIAVLTQRPGRTVILSDFDGSLAPIVERADDARPLPEAVDVLTRLADHFGRVGVVSGRPFEYLARYLPIDSLAFSGLYGYERRIDGVYEVDPRVTIYRERIAHATDELAARFDDLVENKAGISVTVHWRPRPELEPEMSAFACEVARRYNLDTYATRMAIELRPPVPIDKGDAVRALTADFDIGAFAGDDRGDIPAFRALSEMEQSVRIGVRSPEMPPDLAAESDVIVDGPEGLLLLLRRVLDAVA